jgi:hypothetical protein
LKSEPGKRPEIAGGRKTLEMEAALSSETLVTFQGIHGAKAQKVRLFIVAGVEKFRSNVNLVNSLKTTLKWMGYRSRYSD